MIAEIEHIFRNTPSVVNIYYTHLGYTEYRERVPTFTTWFSK